MASTKTRRNAHQASQRGNLDGFFVFESSFGWVATTWRQGELHCLVFGYEGPRKAVAALPADEVVDMREPIERKGDAKRFAERLQAYFDGERDDFSDVSISLDVKTSFRRDVLECCRKIPYGQTWSYAQLAEAAGSPRACRAVGNIMARNRIPLIIPCHRVVGSHGSLGGYSAATGLTLKRQLLRLEGAEIMV